MSAAMFDRLFRYWSREILLQFFIRRHRICVKMVVLLNLVIYLLSELSPLVVDLVAQIFILQVISSSVSRHPPQWLILASMFFQLQYLRRSNSLLLPQNILI